MSLSISSPSMRSRRVPIIGRGCPGFGDGAACQHQLTAPPDSALESSKLASGPSPTSTGPDSRRVRDRSGIPTASPRAKRCSVEPGPAKRGDPQIRLLLHRPLRFPTPPLLHRPAATCPEPASAPGLQRYNRQTASAAASNLAKRYRLAELPATSAGKKMTSPLLILVAAAFSTLACTAAPESHQRFFLRIPYDRASPIAELAGAVKREIEESSKRCGAS